MIVTAPPGGSAASASISEQVSRAQTSTLAPAADSNSAFHAAASVPPMTTVRRPSSGKNSGSVARRSIRRGRLGVGTRAGWSSSKLTHGLLDGDQAADLGNA